MSYSWNINQWDTTSPAPGYARSVSVSSGGGFALHNFVGYDPRFWTTLTFLGRGAAATTVTLTAQQVGSGTTDIGTASLSFTTSWQTFTVTLATAFGALTPGTLIGQFTWVATTGSPPPIIYITNVNMNGANPAAPSSAITVTVNTAANR